MTWLKGGTAAIQAEESAAARICARHPRAAFAVAESAECAESNFPTKSALPVKRLRSTLLGILGMTIDKNVSMAKATCKGAYGYRVRGPSDGGLKSVHIL